MPRRKIVSSANGKRPAPESLPPPPAAPSAERLRYHHAFPSTHLGNERSLVVWVPPDYDLAPERRHPVLYLHDGQNVFDPATAAFGVAWEAGRIAERLIQQRRIPPLLMVGIYNTPDRIDEYTYAFDRAHKGGGKGRHYGRFVLDEVKPFIDRTYRTLPGRDHTGVAGSSLGGLITLTMAREHHARFRHCGVLSPALWWAKAQILRDVAEGDTAWMRSMRFWVDMGTREGNRRGPITGEIARTRALIQTFDGAGLLPGAHYYYSEVAGGEHNEAHWAARFDKVLLYFFGQVPG
jgi:predicted alpha/beta superfamily hydrolase